MTGNALVRLGHLTVKGCVSLRIPERSMPTTPWRLISRTVMARRSKAKVLTTTKQVWLELGSQGTRSRDACDIDVWVEGNM